MKKIEVVAAVIFSENGEQVFIARRANDAHQGGLWEFPGGKKEPEESAQQALYRELNEELGIHVSESAPFIKLNHDYGDKLIELDVYQVSAFKGHPHGAEGQETKWVMLSDLNNLAFPEANNPILKRLLNL